MRPSPHWSRVRRVGQQSFLTKRAMFIPHNTIQRRGLCFIPSNKLHVSVRAMFIPHGTYYYWWQWGRCLFIMYLQFTKNRGPCLFLAKNSYKQCFMGHHKWGLCLFLAMVLGLLWLAVRVVLVPHAILINVPWPWGQCLFLMPPSVQTRAMFIPRNFRTTQTYCCNEGHVCVFLGIRTLQTRAMFVPRDLLIAMVRFLSRTAARRKFW